MSAPAPFDVEVVRAQFPLLSRRVHGLPLAYLDSAASAQKPLAVLDAMDHFQRQSYANVKRGVHQLAEEATNAYESARATVARFLGGATDEVVFVRGTTEAVNLVAQSFLANRLTGDDEVLVTTAAHHSNLVPYQLLGERTGLHVRPIPLAASGEIDLDQLAHQLSPRTRLVAISHVSNVLGTIDDVAAISALAHQHGVPVLVDGAQAIHHLPVDVSELGCDFYAFSAHKAYGPTGCGVLWAKREHLAAMPPWQGGGEMVGVVSFAATTYADPPARFEAGTPNLVGAVGLAAALDWLSGLDRIGLARHETTLLDRAAAELEALDEVTLLGSPASRTGVLSFVVDGVHPHDLATLLDRGGIAVRAGHHCAQPLHRSLGHNASTRASVAAYTTGQEIDRLVAGVLAAKRLFD